MGKESTEQRGSEERERACAHVLFKENTLLLILINIFVQVFRKKWARKPLTAKIHTWILWVQR